MNKITTIALTTITALATTVPSMAQGVSANYSNHVALGRAIQSTGVNYQINPAVCWEMDALGYYWGYKNQFVVCQENKRSVGVEAIWTQEDLDTVRHEAQHLIQDCVDGSRQGALGSAYKDPIGLATNVLGDRAIRGVLESYSEKSDHVKVMELEAFSVAAMNKPLEQVSDIKHYCL